MIKLESKVAGYAINCPTDISEFTPEILTEISKNINLPKHYCIVGICYKVTLFELIISSSKKNTSVSVSPILVKISEEDSKDINAVVGDKIIICRSNLERGTHLRLPVSIGLDSVYNFITSDKELHEGIIKRNMNIKDHKVILMEFKIVPVNDISAAIHNNGTIKDPFIVNTDEHKEENKESND